jgi:alpha-tubulin suppressor-like RCC1 family protein
MLGQVSEEPLYQAPTFINPLQNSEKIIHVACAECTSFAITESGSLFSWGGGYDGLLGRDEVYRLGHLGKEVVLPPGVKIAEVSAGPGHVLARSTEGEIYAWGNNSLRHLGIGDQGIVCGPTRIELPEPVVRIFCGGKSSFALTKNGCLYAWGDNNFGQFGFPVTTQIEEKPVKTPLVDVLAVAPGGDHIYFLFGIGPFQESENFSQMK